MRFTALFLASLGFAVPSSLIAQPVSEQAVKRMEEHQACVRDCDSADLSSRSAGLEERQARRRYMACRMECNDVLTGRRPNAKGPVAEPAAMR